MLEMTEAMRLARCEAICNQLRMELEEVLISEYELAVQEQDADRASMLARKRRNLYLVNSDNRCTFDRIIPDIPTGDTFEDWLPFLKELSSHKIDAWGEYRQHLRDIPNQAGFPFDIDWGTPPKD